MDELVNQADIARRVGRSKQAVWELSRRDKTFPKPVQKVGRSRLYSWPTVRAYYLERGATITHAEPVVVGTGPKEGP